MQSEELPMVILSGVVAIFLFELFKFILTTKCQIKLKMEGEPWVDVVKEVQPVQAREAGDFPRKRLPMPKFWEMHIDDVKFEAIRQGLQVKNIKKDELVQQLVELHR